MPMVRVSNGGTQLSEMTSTLASNVRVYTDTTVTISKSDISLLIAYAQAYGSYWSAYVVSGDTLTRIGGDQWNSIQVKSKSGANVVVWKDLYNEPINIMLIYG